MRYVLECEVPNEWLRNGELRKNKTNLAMRWKGISASNNLDELIKIKGKNQRIFDRETGDIYH